MNIRRTHSLTRESFAKMTEERLRQVIRRTYKCAADSAADQRGAQWELQRRRLVAQKKRG